MIALFQCVLVILCILYLLYYSQIRAIDPFLRFEPSIAPTCSSLFQWQHPSARYRSVPMRQSDTLYTIFTVLFTYIRAIEPFFLQRFDPSIAPTGHYSVAIFLCWLSLFSNASESYYVYYINCIMHIYKNN